MRRFRTLIVILLAVSLLVGPGVAQAKLSPQLVPPDRRPSSLLRAALVTQLQQHYPNLFAGVTLGITGAARVHVTATTPGLIRLIQAIGRQSPKAAVHIHLIVDAHNSLRSLRSLQAQLTAEHQELRTRGVLVGDWGIDVQHNRVRVGVIGLTPKARAVLLRLFGPDKIEVVNSTPIRLTSRYADSPPWQSGDLLTSGSVACTSGFNFYVRGSYYLSTAGHCGIGSWFSGRSYLGQTAAITFNNYGYADAQLIAPSGLVGGGAFVSTNTTVPVVSFMLTAQQGIGSSICVDGSFSGQSCDARITSVNSCYYLQNDQVIMCGLISAQSSTPAVQPGDSGGPVYQRVRGGITACGMIVGGDSSGTELIYTPVQSVMTIFGAALVVQ